MPFPFISAALGICFLLVWALIGGMIFRDSRFTARSELDADVSILPLAPPHMAWPRKSERPRRPMRGRQTARAAS